MDQNKKPTGGLEWRVHVPDGPTKLVLVPKSGLARRVSQSMRNFAAAAVMKPWNFLKKSYELGVDDPRKFFHCLKVGMALTIVSLFYYMRPLYQGFGGNAMWAVMTVVVVFENSVGATIYKSLNRIFGTTLAGFLAIGVHWIAVKSGERFEPLIVGVSVFSLASAATFSRFIPKVKEMFDYGAMIFILTFSLVAVSGYRVDKLLDMAHYRISTIIVGTSLCILVSMLICPIWAGQKLHTQICQNMEKLASSLDGYVIKYFNQDDELEDKKSDKSLLGYKCVLSSKATEESLAKFARWEPAHGHFNFKHPWKQYIKIGASMRNCAYCIEALRSCIGTEDQAPEFVKNHISSFCQRVSSNCSNVLRELATSIKRMKRSSDIKFLIEEMSSSVEELQATFKSLSSLPKPSEISQHSEETKNASPAAASLASVSLMEIIPAATLASLLIDIASRVETIADEVKELANLAEFKDSCEENSKEIQSCKRDVPDQVKDVATISLSKKSELPLSQEHNQENAKNSLNISTMTSYTTVT